MNPEDFPHGTIVSAGVLAGAYPKGQKWDEHRQLWHAARIVADDWPEPLCKKVKRRGSVNDDSTQFNLHPVTCPACLAKLRVLGVTIEVRRSCAICGKEMTGLHAACHSCVAEGKLL
jgi:hypothetical protein